MNRDMPEQLRLLLIEDSPADVFLVREALREEALHCEMEVAEDGEAAIHILEKVDAEQGCSAPNFLLVDLNIPRRNGSEVLERLRRSPRCGDIPVIVISSSDSPVERKRVFEQGATEYFRKPSNLVEFLSLGKVIRRLHERRLSAA